MSGVQYHITYPQILESQRRLNLSNILKQFIQTFSPTSDEFIDIACDPYIEVNQYLNSTNIDINVLQSIVFLLMVKLWTVILEQLVAIILFSYLLKTKIEITLARKYDLVRLWFSEVAF